MTRNKWNCFSLRKASHFFVFPSARCTVKTIAPAPLCRKVHNTVINACSADAVMYIRIKMQNRETLRRREQKQIRQMPTCARRPQQNPSNSDTNEVCKVYKCSSASFILPLSTFRGFYLSPMCSHSPRIVWWNTRWDTAFFSPVTS